MGSSMIFKCKFPNTTHDPSVPRNKEKLHYTKTKKKPAKNSNL
ncbi:hypothetical protein OIU84_022590 [Salix udensis]|uniref:Uncharacterized protein n=1 Tax=Salix udensis TaxID=889485 RepID=A0AAD6KNZ3_9ROSI|nr:hypothetical protein OIU84_022590 [Salix udensis]